MRPVSFFVGLFIHIHTSYVHSTNTHIPFPAMSIVLVFAFVNIRNAMPIILYSFSSSSVAAADVLTQRLVWEWWLNWPIIILNFVWICRFFLVIYSVCEERQRQANKFSIMFTRDCLLRVSGYARMYMFVLAIWFMCFFFILLISRSCSLMLWYLISFVGRRFSLEYIQSY